MDAGGGGGEPENGADHELAHGGGGHGLEDHALANGGDQAAAMEAGGAVGNGGLQVMAVPNGAVFPLQAWVAHPDPLNMSLLRLPVQEIARCRRVCRPWRDYFSTELFRRRHHSHASRTPMPLILTFQNPGLARFNLRAVDTRQHDIVSRPVMSLPLHHEAWRIHSSSAGILLLSSGDRLYACNPCTRHWARLPPLHVDNHIIGFYRTGIYGHEGYGFEVLYHDRRAPNCEYWIFELDEEAPPPTCIGRPVPVEYDDAQLDHVLANGIAPSYAIPPVYNLVHLWWLPQATLDNSDVLMFDTQDRYFRLVPPPTIQVGGEDIPVGVGHRLLEIGERLAMTFVSPMSLRRAPARVDVWIRNYRTEFWVHRYIIPLQVDAPLQEDVINLNGGYHQNVGVFAVARDRSGLAQRPRILLTGHGIFLSRHTIQESLLLHPYILPLGDEDAVDGDPPFSLNQ